MNTKTRTSLNDPQPHIGPLISSYQDGLTTEAETQQVERHLLECEQCRGFYSGLQQARELIGELPSNLTVSPEAEEADLYAVMSRTVYPANRKKAKKILKEERKK